MTAIGDLRSFHFAAVLAERQAHFGKDNPYDIVSSVIPRVGRTECGGSPIYAGFTLIPGGHHALAVSAGTPPFSQQWACGPRTPGFTWVHERHDALSVQACWHMADAGAGRGMLAMSPPGRSKFTAPALRFLSRFSTSAPITCSCSGGWEYRTCAVLLMRDDSTRRVYLLHIIAAVPARSLPAL
jgi:hypothetical protein